MKFLISTTEVHRVDTENEAVMLIEDAKKDGNFILTKYSTEHKEKKVTLTKRFTDIKEPSVQTTITYDAEDI